MSERFYESEVVRNEMGEMQQLYEDLYTISLKFPTMVKEDKKEHIEKTMELIAKQKVFYARLQLAANELQDDDSAKAIKDNIERMSVEYAEGLNLTTILDHMEGKLRHWREELLKDGVDRA